MEDRVKELEVTCKKLETQLAQEVASRAADQERFAEEVAQAKSAAEETLQTMRSELEMEHQLRLNNFQQEVRPQQYKTMN